MMPPDGKCTMAAERNLILVHQPYRQDIRDFHAIAERVEDLAPDIRAFVVYNSARNVLTRKKAAGLPTLVFSPGELDDFRPARGKIYAGHFIPKSAQMQRLAQAGVPVPPFVGPADDPAKLRELSDIVLVKADDRNASLGQGIQLRRRSDLERERAGGGDTPAGGALVQSYIDTGPYPSNYRVHTLFGRTLLAYRKISTVRGPDPDMPDSALREAVFQARARTGQRHEICREDDVLALARRAYEAMPEIPLHGCDIVRDCGSGRLYVLEINAGGNTWVFSYGSRDAPYTLRLRDSLGVADLAAPFDTFTVAAHALIAKTREEAA
jgi:hypothetical protein